MNRLKLLAVGLMAIALYVGASAAQADAHSHAFIAGKIAKGAPIELQHWAKLIGQWSTTEEGLRADGSGFDPSKGADWDFFWAFDGWGIQDNYTSPAASEAIEDESKRQRGVNLRIYDPKAKRWVMTWLTPGSTTPSNFTATSDDQTIVMTNDVLNPQGYHTRITFFDMADDSFDWKLEWSKDEESWREVYRIHGSRKP